MRTRRVVATPTERAVHAGAAHRLAGGSRAAQGPRPGLRACGGAAPARADRRRRCRPVRRRRRLLVRDPPEDPCGRRDSSTRAGAPREAISGQRRVLTARQTPRWWPSRCSPTTAVVIGVLVVVTTRTPVAGNAGRRRRSGALRRQPDRARRAGRLPGPARPRRGAGVARADQPALHLQRAEHHRLVRAHRSRPGPRTHPGLRRLHPVLVSRRRAVHHARRRTAQHRPLPDPRARPVRHRIDGHSCRWRPRCSPSSCRSWRCSRWWRTRCGTAWPGGRAVRSKSSPATRVPTASSPSRTTVSGMDPERLRSGHGDVLTARGRATSGPRRADQCRPSAAGGVRQRLRSGGRDRARRGYQGDHAGAEVPAGRAGLTSRGAEHDSAADDRAGGRRRGPCARRAHLPAAASTPHIGRGDAAPATPPRRCANSTNAPSTRSSSTSTCPACRVWNSPVCWRISPTRPRSSSSPHTTTRRSPPSTSARRLPAQADPQGPPRRSRPAGGSRRGAAEPAQARRGARADADVIPAELGGVTQLVPLRHHRLGGGRRRLRAAALHVRLAPGANSVEHARRPAGAKRGFQRVHRSYLVALSMVTGLRTAGASVMVRMRANGASPAVELPVSRRQARELRDRLIRDPMRSLPPR